MSETKTSKDECVASLKTWLQQNPHMPEIPDEVLHIFLNCRSYDVELTKKTLEAYLEISTKTPELFSNYDPILPEIIEAMSILHIAVLPKRDNSGRVVLIYRLSDEDPSKANLENLIKFSCMSSYIASYQSRDAPGYVLIFDSAPVKLGHIAKLSISTIRKFLAFLQEASPIDIKRIHVVNTSSITYMILNFTKPFLRKELADKLVFHTSNLEKLYDEVNQEILPEDYGGSEISMEELNRRNQKNVNDNREILLQREKFRIDESKRPTSSK